MPVLNIRNYTADDIFEKNLLFLLPFIFFLYENKLAEYNEDEGKLREFMKELNEILGRLKDVCTGSEHTARTIIELMINVADSLASRYEKVRKEAWEGMYGKVLDYSTKTILNEGKAEGSYRSNLKAVKGIMEDFNVDFEKACTVCKLTESEKEEVLKALENEYHGVYGTA